MKTLILLLNMILTTLSIRAQAKYAFVYAYSSSDKVLYISNLLDESNFSNCKDSGYYGTNTLKPGKCIEKQFTESVTIQAGSTHNTYNIKVRECKSETPGYYTCNDYFNDEGEVNSAIRDIKVKYRGLGYALQILSLN